MLIGSVSQSWFKITYLQALIFGYIVASIAGFFLTRLFGFSQKNSTKSRREMLKFSLVAVLSFLITVYGANALFNYSVSKFGLYNFLIPSSVKTVNVNKLVSQLFCMGLSFSSNYILHKRFTFRDTGFYSRLKKFLFL